MKTLLYSRKFWLAVWGLIQTIVGHLVQLPTDIIVALDALVMVLIASIAAEDAAEKRSGINFIDPEK